MNLRTPRASREKKKDGDREFAKPPSHNNPAKMRIKMPAVRIAQGKEEKEGEENCVGWKSRPACRVGKLALKFGGANFARLSVSEAMCNRFCDI